MLSTNFSSKAFSYTVPSIEDSTVYVNPGATQIGNTILSYPGGNINFKQMTDFLSPNKYQYSALMLENDSNVAGLVSVTSTAVDSTDSLQFPIVDPSLHPNPLSPVGLFLFHYDGTGITLEDSEKTVQGGGAGLQGVTGIVGSTGIQGLQGITGMASFQGVSGVEVTLDPTDFSTPANTDILYYQQIGSVIFLRVPELKGISSSSTMSLVPTGTFPLEFFSSKDQTAQVLTFSTGLLQSGALYFDQSNTTKIIVGTNNSGSNNIDPGNFQPDSEIKGLAASTSVIYTTIPT